MVSQIQLATIQHLSEIKSLTEDCASAMQQKNIFQWNEHYPSLEVLQKDIENQELYVFKESNSVLGIIVITDNMDAEYQTVTWLTSSNSKNLYIHRLATAPRIWGEGVGRKLMDFAENYAREHKFDSVRLDTFSQNKRNQKFYEQRGYLQLENIYFPRQSEHPFYCYELLL